MHKSDINTFFRFFKFIIPYRKKWFLILLLSNTAALLALVNPYLTKLFVDEGIGKKDFKSFIFIALIGGSVFLFNELLNSIKNFLEQYIKTWVHFDLNKKLFKHIHNLSLGWFSDKSTGEHIYKISYDIEAVKDFITGILPQALFIFPKSLFVLAMVFYLNWQMALFSLCLVPLVYLPPYYFNRKLEGICEDLVRNSEEIFKSLGEMFSHIQLIKAFGKETASIRNYIKKLILAIRINTKNIKLEIISSFTAEFLTKIIIGAITFYGGYKVIKGSLSLGSLTAIMVCLYQLFNLQKEFASFFQSITIGSVSCRRIAEILDERPQIIESETAKNIAFKKADVIFNNVSFGYKAHEYVLKNMNFKIEGGSHIAIAGPSGCGKTTLLNLLVRLYDPREGGIFIGGYNIKDLKFNSLRGQIGFVLQEPFLWNDSIENNIMYGREDANRQEMLKASDIAGVEEIVRSLNNGYAAIIGENACKLSEGQKQKIAIARALIKKPKILILDEAMSSMDSASEEKIILNIKKSQRDLTLITVSHRLSTVMSADMVYYLFRPNEMIVDGVRNLFERNSDFARLFTGQDKVLI